MLGCSVMIAVTQGTQESVDNDLILTSQTSGKAVRFEPANAWDTAEKYNVDVDGSIVTSKGTGHSHILSNYCVSSGKASWEFKLVKDVSGNEMSCFGAATKPCSSEKYDSNSSMYMLRG